MRVLHFEAVGTVHDVARQLLDVVKLAFGVYHAQQARLVPDSIQLFLLIVYKLFDICAELKVPIVSSELVAEGFVRLFGSLRQLNVGLPVQGAVFENVVEFCAGLTEGIGSVQLALGWVAKPL